MQRSTPSMVVRLPGDSASAVRNALSGYMLMEW